MNWEKIISEKDFAFHRIGTLVFFLVTSSLTIIGVVIPFIKDYFPQPFVHFLILGLVELFIICYWYYDRTIYPKNKGNKKSLVIAITTENSKQKTRIAHDFTNQIQKRLRDFGLDSKYEIVILHNHLSKETQKKINLWAQSQKAGLLDSENVLKFNKMVKRLNATFFIFGDLIKRNSSNSTYCLSLEAMILHPPTNPIQGQVLLKEFHELWKREMTFLEEDELNGFKSNAEHVFFATSYMIGLVSFIDNNYKQGIEIWDALEKYIKDKPELANYHEKIIHLKSISYFLFSRFLYFNGQIEESTVYGDKFLALTPNEYFTCLTEAIKQVKIRNDAGLALQFIEKAKMVAAGDGTWRYSKLYLLIKLNKHKEALQVLDEIIANKPYPNENDTIAQVTIYNLTCLKEDPLHYQTLFIIGTLTYKKLNSPTNAYERLEEFIKLTNGNASWKLLNERAKEYITEINRIIGVR